jgi:hypothetical protein
MKLSPLAILASAAALLVVATLGTAQIERLDLAQMVAKTDNAVLGKIVARHVVRIDHPVDGPELYFSTLTIEGKSLQNGKPVTVDVSHMGGWIDETHGSFNSEAPSADDTKIGNTVVCFYKHVENMGGDFAGNVIYTWHGGIYRTFERKGAVIVQGRGDGYAIPTNIALSDLESQVSTLAKQK